MAARRLRLATRGSALALAQARAVAGCLAAAGYGESELVVLRTGGDRGQRGGDKARWVDALEDALVAGDVDLAVHSAKDVPGALAPGLALLGVPSRADPRDVLCGAPSLDALPPGARVGTSALRRRALLLAAREDIEVVELRGNVDTRLRRLQEGGLEALVLARAGLERLGRPAAGTAALDPAVFVPAPGQGALALEGRAGDERARAAAEAVTDPAARAALTAERAVVRALDASCRTPVGAWARHARSGTLALSAVIGLPDGSATLRDDAEGDPGRPEELGRRVAERLLAAGGGELLAAAEALAERLPGVSAVGTEAAGPTGGRA